MKTLHDMCLSCIARNVSKINRLGTFLSSKHKEILLERLCWHQLFTDENAPSISYHLFSPALQRVNLSYCSQVDDKILYLLSQSRCTPRSISIDNCPQVTDKGLKCLSQMLGYAEQLTLKKLKHLTSEGLKLVRSEAITSVDLSECSSITGPGIASLVSECPNISTLNVDGLHKVADETLVYVARCLGEKLEDLDATDLNLITCVSTRALAEHCPNLTRAVFDGCVRIDGSGLIDMVEMCNITSLSISFCYKVCVQKLEVVFSTLRAKGSIHCLEMLGITVSPLTVEVLSFFPPSLTHLSLCGVQTLTDSMVDMITKKLGQSLLKIDLSNCLHLTDSFCRSLALQCTFLEELGMRNLQAVNGTDLLKLFTDKRAKNFKVVTLSGSKNMSVKVVYAITSNCTNLEILTLAGLRNVTDEVASAIAHSCPNLQQVSFRNTDLTDTGVCDVAVHCSKLTMVALAGIHSLTDKSVIALAENVPYLEELYISGCARITKQAVAYLKDCVVRRVFVNHSTPNAPVGLLMAKDLDTGCYTRVDDMSISPLPLKRLH